MQFSGLYWPPCKLLPGTHLAFSEGKGYDVKKGQIYGHFFVNSKKIARTGHIVRALLQHLEGT